MPTSIPELVDKFGRNQDAYLSSQYNETQLRREFLDPLFGILGWDIENKQGYAEVYKDVIHEDAIKIGSATKAPDYSFRVGGIRKFFVEAKKPSVNLKDDVSPAYQLRRYAWSSKLPLSVLTDFQEFVVYDCRVKPFPDDKPSTGRILYLQYTDYESRWNEIADVFSKEAVLKGSFDKYAETNKGKKGTSEVDDAFLQEIESWRKTLAMNVALRNPKLTQRELNSAVQRTIDRIIFLRICEDRGIETYGKLMAFQNGTNVYKRLTEVFQRADEKYNSGLFHFQKEKNRGEAPDELTLGLVIDDKPLKDIIKNLYYPDSPYEFSVLPADILGQVYEQFLGKVIRLTAGHHAVVEDKPEVKKAGGVYYTPTYIVEYIVKNTVGKSLEGLTPKQASRLRILDPACGSGSFLIGAYQYLLDWHRAWYVKDGTEKWTKGKAPALYQSQEGEWRLTTMERKRILLNNIYGVDIDSQAVETTKLSLLLKVLEGENEQTISRQLKMFQERALPDLGNNIKCGNSLIGPDFYSGQESMFGGDDERMRINAFDWKAEFKETMDGGGFDVVIGNPPYIRIQAMKEWAPIEVEFYKRRYHAASSGNYDIYVVFVEKGLDLLNSKGVLGFILPHKFFNSKYGEPLRGLLANGKHLLNVVHFGDQQVFAGATTYTCLLFLGKNKSKEFTFAKVKEISGWRNQPDLAQQTIPALRLNSSEWVFQAEQDSAVIQRLMEHGAKLGEIAHLFVGLQTDADDVFIVEQVRTDGKRVLCESKATGEKHWFEDNHLKAFLKGSLNVRRYVLSDVTKRLIFPYHTINSKSELIDRGLYQKDFPLTWKYLESNRSRLARRNKGNMGGEWYGYVYKKNHTRFDSPKILVPSIATGSCFAIDAEGQYYFVGSGGGGGGGYGIILSDRTKLSPLYLLGLLNSNVLNMCLHAISTPFRGGYIALNRQYIEQLPIRTIDFSDPADKSRHDSIVGVVQQMLDLHKKLSASKLDHEQNALRRQIDATDKQIDALVYELYGLTDEEIKIVEGDK